MTARRRYRWALSQRRMSIHPAALLVFIAVILVASDARAALILLDDTLAFSYDLTVQPLLYGVDEDGNPGEFLGPGPVEHFAGSAHGSTFGVDGNSWEETVYAAPRTDAYRDQDRYGQFF